MLGGYLRETYGPLVSMVAGGLSHLYCLSDHDCELVLSCGLLERGVVNGELWYLVGGGEAL